MVLFLFVIMLLSIHEEGIEARMPRAVQWIGAAGALGLFGLLVAAVWQVAGDPAPLAADFGTVKAVGKVLYSQYLLPFEATSLLLLVAIVGSVVVAKERI
jgi:NADH-quinone oxidoreductase subunit J